MYNSYNLWKTIHSPSDLYVDVSVVYNVSEVMFVDNLVEYCIKGQWHIFVLVHYYVEIKV